MFEKTIIVSELSSSALNFVECINDLKEMITPRCLLLHFTREQETNPAVSSFVERVYEDNLSQQKNILHKMGWVTESNATQKTTLLGESFLCFFIRFKAKRSYHKSYQ